MNIKGVDVKKIQNLSMLTIDNNIMKNINQAINVAERMFEVETINMKPLIHYEYLK